MGIHAGTLVRTLERSRAWLLSLRGADGCWRGVLSSSALSTATAAFALSRTGLHGELIGPALAWLRANQNDDGGWGDTTRSPSNLSTTLLAWSALSQDGAVASDEGNGDAAGDGEKANGEAAASDGGSEAIVPAEDLSLVRAEAYIQQQAGSTRAADIAAALAERYGDDRTFCVPILMMCALSGRLGEGDAAWAVIPPLPFEAAALPHAALRWLRLPVVSYAMPALIAVGQAVHHHRRSGNFLTRGLRAAVTKRTRAKLRKIQPDSGGFLEAAPLTSFVMMALASIGQGEHPSVTSGGEFLARTVRPDGSWAIDTDLATWVTTLSINALSSGGGAGDGGGLANLLSVDERVTLLRTLLSRQLKRRHRYTDAAPGGWAWTDLSGGVPDADDTAGALLAMANLCASLDAEAAARPREHADGQDAGETEIAALLREAHRAAERGLRWLTGVQNRDGGVPTFCRGWGRLPFDRSSPDLTAHAALAIHAWSVRLRGSRRRIRSARRLREFLEQSQSRNGSWTPLWFGNERADGGRNPVYGTARVLLCSPAMLSKGGACGPAVDFLLSQQNADGGWGACLGVESSVEETAVAVEALCCKHDVWAKWRDVPELLTRQPSPLRHAIERGVSWLIDRTDGGRVFPPAPIGLYFASLWYYEQLYPVTMTVAALTRAARLFALPWRGAL